MFTSADAQGERESVPEAAASPGAVQSAWVRRRADLIALGIILLVGLAVRLVFATRAPMLLQGDSETYLGPAVDLLRGSGLDLMLKRTPGYPLAIVAAFAALGQWLGAIGLLQHALGLGTAALAFLVARLVAGPGAGLLAGLATALAGNLLVYERFVMSEALFTTLLAAAVAALVLASSREDWYWPLLAGLAIGAATLVRPVAQALLVLAPLALLVGAGGRDGETERRRDGETEGRRESRRPSVSPSLRPVLTGTAFALIGYGLLLVPWTVRGTGGADGVSVGALGQTLVGRTARHDRYDPASGRGFVYYDPARDAEDPDPTRLAARKVLQEAARSGSSGRTVHTRLRKELGLSDAATDRLMRDLAFEAILRRPGYYLSGTVERFGRLWVTSPERLSGSWRDRDTIIGDWEHAASRALLEQPAEPIEREMPTVEALTSALQPSRLGVLYPALFALGLFAAAGNRRYRPSLIPILATLLLMTLSVALVGGVARYRYPEDPLIFATIAIGLAWAVDVLRRRPG